MSEIHNLALIVTILLLVTVINEFAIRLFRVKNPNTRFWIYVVSLIASFSIFYFLPLRYTDLVITFEKSSLEGKIYTIQPDSISFIARYTGFAVFSFALLMLSMLFFVAFLILNRIIIERRANMGTCRSRKVLGIVASLEQEFGIRVRKVSTYDGDSNAYVYGFPPSLAISRRLVKKLKEDELKIILRHEFCHIKNNDTLLKPFLISLCLLFFYNPAVHFIYKRIMEQREYIADKKAISTPQDKRMFLSLLLKVHGVPVSSGMNFTSKTSRRVEILLSEERHRWIPLLLSSMLTFSIISACNLYFMGDEKSPFSIPTMNYYTETIRSQNNFEERVKRKEKFEFFIPEDVSILKALNSSENESKRRIVIKEWEYENPMGTSAFRFIIDFDSDGNPLLQLFEKGKREVFIEKHKEMP